MPITSILVVDDSYEDYHTLRRLLKEQSLPYALVQCEKGEDVLDMLYQRGKFAVAPADVSWPPALVLLDLNLIGLDGKFVLTQLKQDNQFKQLPVVIYTTSNRPDDIFFCYQNGANSYLLKPVHIQHLREQIHNFFNYWFNTVELPISRGVSGV